MLDGRPILMHVIDMVKGCDIFDTISLITDSKECSKIGNESGLPVQELNSNICICNVKGDVVCFVMGNAPFLKRGTLEKAIEYLSQHRDSFIVAAEKHFAFDDITKVYELVEKEQPVGTFSVFCHGYTVNNWEVKTWILERREALLINDSLDFEAALILKQKEKNSLGLTVKKRIQEKRKNLKVGGGQGEICLVGHSIFDNWGKNYLGNKNFKVRNAGIRGISSRQYNEWIIKEGLLNCDSEYFIVMQGTNDLNEGYLKDEIIHDILWCLDYIYQNMPIKHDILFFGITNVNGRLDRNNQSINELNMYIRKNMPSYAKFIEMKELNDEYGNLSYDFTTDGLHLNEEGYRVLERIVLKNILIMDMK